jgi:acyl-CoA-binding protein
MELKEKFEAAVVKSKDLTQRPSNDELLTLYALFKQATEGDNSSARPGGFDFKGAAKHDAWDKLKDKSSDECMTEYIALVEVLHSKY